MSIDWQQFHASDDRSPAVVDPRRRLRIFGVVFLVGLLVVIGRAIQLEVAQGDGFRAVALRPVEQQWPLPAARGRILARDGTPLAFDRTIAALAVDYRRLEAPPDPDWLRAQTRARLSKKDRSDPKKVAATRQAIVSERSDQNARLARLCGLSASAWALRARQIQTRVERIADRVNQRQKSKPDDETDASWAIQIRRLLLEDPPPPHITVSEELTSQVMAEDVPQTVVDEINHHPDRYPGTKIVTLLRRNYPEGAFASHVLGHLGAIDEKTLHDADEFQRYGNADLVGRMGIERQYESTLRGRPGTSVERRDRSGRLLTSFHSIEPAPGRDVRLTIDPALQRTAEKLLRSALERRTLFNSASESDGGAIVAIDLRDGGIRAAVSAPTFDPNVFSSGDFPKIEALLTDRGHPLLNRTISMALPPGSTFKTVTAAALLESKTIDPDQKLFCRGYLHQPDRQRCEIFIRQHVGHGDVTLADALCVSCNVFFFQFAGQMGPQPLIDWAARCGFGQSTGIDLPGEVNGKLPSPETIARLEGHAWRVVDTQSIAVGQGSLAATPLQVLCMMAALANRGRCVRPHVAETIPASSPPNDLPLSPRTLDAIRDGLERVVADPQGTAHGTVHLSSVAIAGKTGTAETDDDQPGHAWFAGYAPAEHPAMAFVIVLEHAGDAATTAGPLAKRLVLRMDQLGML